MRTTEGPRCLGEELTVSRRTRSGWLLLSVSKGAAQTHRVLIIYCFSCSTLICAAAEVSPCTVFMSHITYLIFALCWSVKLTAFSCRFGRRNGKRKNISPTHPFTQMAILLWVFGQEILGNGPKVHLK